MKSNMRLLCVPTAQSPSVVNKDLPRPSINIHEERLPSLEYCGLSSAH